MKAMVVEKWGEPDVFVERELEKPKAGRGEVVIRVMATSVNPVDTKVRRGLIPVAPDFPAVLHSDVSGIVDSVGEGVEHLSVGDEVYAFAGGFKGWQGALAEYMGTDARLVARKPASLSFREAAAVPLVTITAWLALVDRARVTPSDHVLVHAGAGGVGHVAVQMAKALGARVATTVSGPDKAEIAGKLGADEVINYREETVEDYVARITSGRGFDVVFDTVGGDNVETSMKAVRESGHLLGIALRTKADLTLVHQRDMTFSGVFMLLGLLRRTKLSHYGSILETVSRWTAEGRFRPVLHEKVFTLQEVGAAHALLEAGGVSGKIVVDVGKA